MGDIALLKARAIKVSNNLVDILSDLKSRKFSSEAPQKAIESVIRLLEHLQKTEINAKTLSGSGYDGRFHSLNLTLDELSKCVSYFDNAHIDKTPIPLSYLVNYIVTRAFNDKNYLVYPINTNNYINTYFDHWIKEFLKDRKYDPLYFSELNTKLVGFPRIRSEDILNNVLVAHEIGHELPLEILGEKEAEDDELANFPIRLSLLDSCNEASNAHPDEIEKFAKIHELTYRCLEELISDAVALFIFGPSALFALFEFLTSSNSEYDAFPDPINEYYPSVVTRIEKAIYLLNKLELLEPLTELSSEAYKKYAATNKIVIEEIASFPEQRRTTQKELYSSYMKSCDEIIDLHYDKALEYLFDKLKCFKIDPESISRDIPILVERIRQGIPPNSLTYSHYIQEDSIPSLSNAILSGWVYKLHKMQCSLNKEFELACKEIVSHDKYVNELVSKAIEYILVSEEAYKYKNSKSGD